MQDISYEFEPNTFEKYIPMIDKKIKSLIRDLEIRSEYYYEHKATNLIDVQIRMDQRNSMDEEIDKWIKLKRIVAPKSGLVSISMDEDTFSMLESLECENG